MSDQHLTIPFDDSRPVPEILAEFYKFDLVYHDTDEGRFYSVRDWVAGVANPSDPDKFWHDIKRRFMREGVDLSKQCRKFPVRHINGRIYQRDFADKGMLYLISQSMSKKKGIVLEILTGTVSTTQISAHVYLIGLSEFPTIFKIGIARDLSKRFKNINTSIPFNVYLKHSALVDDYRILEKHLHSVFAEKRVKGEWFSLDAKNVLLAERIMNEQESKRFQITEDAPSITS